MQQLSVIFSAPCSLPIVPVKSYLSPAKVEPQQGQGSLLK